MCYSIVLGQQMEKIISREIRAFVTSDSASQRLRHTPLPDRLRQLRSAAAMQRVAVSQSVSQSAVFDKDPSTIRCSCICQTVDFIKYYS